MKIKSKVVSISTATLLTMTFAVHSFAAVVPFTDITDVAAKEKIIALQEKGYVKGVGDLLFAPNDKITVAESVQLMVNALELNLDLVRFIKEPQATDYFVNAKNDEWYADALIVAAVNGLDFTKDLNPSQKWTREEFVHQLIQAIEKHGNLPKIKLIPTVIADQDQLTVDYDGSVQRALAYGVIKLDAAGKFNPKSEVSRAEAAEQVFNALEYLKVHPAPVMDKN